MWGVFEHRRVAGRLRRLPIEILKQYEKWKDIGGVSGPRGLRMVKGFHDEALQGQWKDARSSCLGLPYRVVYRVGEQEIRVLVIDSSAHGDHRR